MVNNEPKKRRGIAKFIIGGVALLGALLMVLGLILGGRFGTLYAENGQLVYKTSRDTLDLGAAPRWMQDVNVHIMDGYSIFSINGYNSPRWRGGQAESKIEEYYEYEYEPDDEHRAGYGNSYDGKYHTVPGGGSLAFDDAELFEIDIECGFVTVTTGPNPGISVEGPLNTEVYTESGVLHIESDRDMHNITTKKVDGETHFFRNGEDITTRYTITLPTSASAVDLSVGVGSMTVDGVQADFLEAEVQAGGMTLRDITAEYASFEVAAGAMYITGFTGEGVELSSAAGTLEFTGEVANYLGAECEAGYIKISVPRPQDYGYNIQNSMGAVTLDGRTFAGLSTQASSEGSGLAFDLECSVGAIEVEFT